MLVGVEMYRRTCHIKRKHDIQVRAHTAQDLLTRVLRWPVKPRKAISSITHQILLSQLLGSDSLEKPCAVVFLRKLRVTWRADDAIPAPDDCDRRGMPRGIFLLAAAARVSRRLAL